MDKIIVLNHKMNLLSDDVYDYINTLNNIKTDYNLIICPSNIYLETFINNSSWAIGSQNIHYKPEGNYTGEVSGVQLKSLGVEYVIIGHSERKREYNESDEVINLKLIAALDNNIIPILCVGENKGENKNKVLKEQLDKYLKNIDHIQFIIFAYEPCWAIGSGLTPTKEEIEETINYLKSLLEDKYQTKPTILYGGSVDYNNIKQISEIDNLNGLLIGSKSSKKEEIEKILIN